MKSGAISPLTFLNYLQYFPHRYWVGVVAAIHDSNGYDAVKSWVDNIDKRLSKYGIYPQGPDTEKVGNRLMQLKLKYDPGNFFHQNINIDPEKAPQSAAR